MQIVSVVFFCLLALCTLFSVYGAGQGFNKALPGHYHDSDPSVYRFDGFLFTGCAALFAMGALWLLARIIGGDKALRLPLSAYVLVAVLVASGLPYEGWIDASGSWNSVGYSINIVLIGLTVALTQVTVSSLRRQKESRDELETRGPTGRLPAS
jgi:O-antigen/teichoic acid export membrane protein